VHNYERSGELTGTLKFLVPLSLIIVGIIHLIPLSGVMGAERLNALYAINISDPDLSILMRHRAVLFGLLGAFCIYAAIRPSLQLVALIAGAVSVVSFLFLAYTTANYNEELQRVVIADVTAAAFLTIGFMAYFVGRSGGNV
jgi:hypothetical protein